MTTRSLPFYSDRNKAARPSQGETSRAENVFAVIFNYFNDS